MKRLKQLFLLSIFWSTTQAGLANTLTLRDEDFLLKLPYLEVDIATAQLAISVNLSSIDAIAFQVDVGSLVILPNSMSGNDIATLTQVGGTYLLNIPRVTVDMGISSLDYAVQLTSTDLASFQINLDAVTMLGAPNIGPDTGNAADNLIGASSASTCRQAGDFDMPACFIINGSNAEMYGVIGSGIVSKVNQLTSNYPTVTNIVMVNVPGSMDDFSNLAAGRAVFAAMLNTEVRADSLIASGGVDFFLAGRTRVVKAGAMIGVHSWSAGTDSQGNELTGADLPRDDPEHELYLNYYRDINLPDPAGFYFFTLNAAPASSIHYMTAAELTQFSIANP
ncbi:MAG: hypothetical protein AAF512_02075 [Pseudomonadota bacterium]